MKNDAPGTGAKAAPAARRWPCCAATLNTHVRAETSPHVSSHMEQSSEPLSGRCGGTHRSDTMSSTAPSVEL